jgi:hypothetical protein
MAYFPHAYQKLLVGTNATSFYDGDDTNGANGTVATTSLGAGQIGIVSGKDHKIADLDHTPTYSEYPMIYLAQGSFHANDKIGPYHGGYKETVKTKGINPKYVSAFYLTTPASPVQSVRDISVLDCTSIACNSTYRMRIDIKGSPALRFLTHNAYLTMDAYTGCCDSSNNNVDPVIVLLQWRDQIKNSPLISKFVSPKVFNYTGTGYAASTTSASTSLTLDDTSGAGGSTPTGLAVGQLITGAGIPANTYITAVSGGTLTLSQAATVAATTTAIKFYSEILLSATDYVPETGASAPDTNDAHLILTGAYADTTFGNCSFSPMDHVEYQPIEIYTSMVDISGNPCTTSCFVDTQLVQTYQGKGFGETLVRELILAKRYQQEPWMQDPRLREVLDDTTLTELSRTSSYMVYHILHSVPRKSNPTGMMDSDQYLVKVVIPVQARTSGTPAYKFETWMNALLTSAGNNVQLDASTAL